MKTEQCFCGAVLEVRPNDRFKEPDDGRPKFIPHKRPTLPEVPITWTVSPLEEIRLIHRYPELESEN